MERVRLAAGSGLAVAPTRLPRPRGLGRWGGGGVPPGSGAAIGETQAPGAAGGRSGSPVLPQEGGKLAGRRRPCSLPRLTCSLAGVSWQRIDAFKLWCWRILPWTARRSNQSILKEINPEYSLEGLMLKLKLQSFGHLMGRADSFEKTLMLGKTEAGREGGDRG